LLMVARELLTKSKVASSTGTDALSALGAMRVVCDVTLTLCTDDWVMTHYSVLKKKSAEDNPYEFCSHSTLRI